MTIKNETPQNPYLSIWIILLFVVPYVILEILLNTSLIEAYGQASQNLVNDNYSLHLANLELAGRYITGFGLAFIFTPYIYAKLIKKFFWPALHKIIFPLVFVVIWILVAVASKVFVESLVHSSSPEDKFSAVRSILSKELYANGQLEFEKLPVFNEALKNPETKQVVTALIPSLTYVSSDLDNEIAVLMYPFLAELREEHVKERYTNEVNPIILAMQKEVDNEFDLYKQYRIEFIKKEEQNNFINSQVDEVLFTAKNLQLAMWQDLQQDLGNREHWIKYVYSNQKFLANVRSTFYDNKGCYREKYKGKRPCPIDYQEKEISAWLAEQKMARFDNDYWFVESNWTILGKLLQFPFSLTALTGEYLFSCGWKDTLKERENCGHVKTELIDRPIDIDKFNIAHAQWLKDKWPFDVNITQQRFNNLEKIKGAIRKVVGNKYQVDLPGNWTVNERSFLYSYYKNDAEQKVNNVVKEYQSKSDFDFDISTSPKFRDRDEFYKMKEFDRLYQSKLKTNYYEKFELNRKAADSYEYWKKTQTSSINILKMVTSEITKGFALGGPFYKLGVDAIMYTIVPTISIGLSLISVLFLFGKVTMIPLYSFVISKIINTLDKQRKETNSKFESLKKAIKNRNKEKLEAKRISRNTKIRFIIGMFLFSLYLLLILTPVYFGSFYKGFESYQNKSIKNENDLDSIKWGGLAYILEVEKIMYESAPDIKLGDQKLEFIDVVDKFIYPVLRIVLNTWYSTDNNDNRINILLYHGDYDLVMSAGVNIENSKISSVNVPELFNDTDLNILSEAKIFFKPNYKELFKGSLKDEFKVSELLMNVTKNDVLHQSLKENIEERLLNKMNKNRKLSEYILNQYDKHGAGSNLVFLKTKSNNLYSCYSFPSVELNNLNMLTRNEIIISKKECRWIQ